MSGLTEKQEEILSFIYNFYKKRYISPTIREIKDSTSHKGHSSIINHIDALQEKGFIIKEPNKWRGITITDKTKELYA